MGKEARAELRVLQPDPRPSFHQEAEAQECGSWNLPHFLVLEGHTPTTQMAEVS